MTTTTPAALDALAAKLARQLKARSGADGSPRTYTDRMAVEDSQAADALDELKAQVEALATERDAWKAQAESDQASAIAAAQRNLGLIVAREASDTARASAEAALADLIKTATLLQQNSVACAMNHYGGDIDFAGTPGWLVDTEKSIERARAALEKRT